MRRNAERRAPESSSATRPFFEPMLYPGVTSLAAAETVTVFEGIPVDGIDTWLMPGERHSISGRIVWPEGLSMLARESAGEVQTPVTGRRATQLRPGDRVWFRHTKSGELSEHLDEFAVVEAGEVVDTIPTYRGEGTAFL